MFANIRETRYGESDVPTVTEKRRALRVGRLPLMTLTKKCNLVDLSPSERAAHRQCEHDLGGYFVTRGGRAKILVHREYRPFNQTVIVEEANPKAGAGVACGDLIVSPVSCAQTWAATVFSRPRHGGASLQPLREMRVLVEPKTQILRASLRPPRTHPERPPVTLVLRALGIVDRQEMEKIMCFAGPLEPSELRGLLIDSFEFDLALRTPGSELVPVGGLSRAQALEALVAEPYNIVQVKVRGTGGCRPLRGTPAPGAPAPGSHTLVRTRIW